MERGYIKIKENDENQLIVEAKLVNCTLWLTKHEVADLFNVFVNTIANNLRSIFKSGLLREEDITRIHKFENNGRSCETVLYNLEALIFVSYRVASFEAKAFREWAMKALTEYARNDNKKSTEILIVYNLHSKLPAISMN
ncbi:MAG: RhuM family protein [Proteiniphilum sp.]|jgi:hypothetical protein